MFCIEKKEKFDYLQGKFANDFGWFLPEISTFYKMFIVFLGFLQ